MKSSRVLLACAFLLTGTACLEDFSLDQERVGFIDARALDDGGTPVLQVRGAFYRGFGLDAVVGFPGLCQVLQYSPDGDAGGAETLSAGPSVTASIGGGNAMLARTTVGTSISYEMPLGVSLPYTPGDTLTVSVAGEAGGFPAAAIKVRTAEPFVMDPVTPPPTGPALTEVIWTPAPAPGSVMTLSLRYSTQEASETPNSQIYCVFDDDGSAFVPENVRTAWIASNPASRSQFAQRVRESSVVINRATRLRLFSFYAVPTPVLGGT